MPLQSKLLRGDPRLDAVLVSDPAHLTPGTKGPHVAKVQRAVTILSQAVIDAGEMEAGLYGTSTAAAVLAYKQARNIANHAYQSQADDIVGKMTIQALDDEMVRIESSVSPCAKCGDPVSGPTRMGGPMRFTAPRGNYYAAPVRSVGYSLPNVLSIAWQITSIGEAKGGRRLASQVDACNQLMDDLLIIPKGGDLQWVKPFPYTMTINAKARGDIFSLRIAAGQALPLGRSTLRVIVHCYEASSPEFGITDWGEYDNKTYSPFIVLNALKERSDHLTLLHEMIHATGLTVHDDDSQEPTSFMDATSVFSSNEGRTHIRDVHLERLRAMSWCTPWPY